MTKEEIGSVLRELRQSSGRTQKEVAELLGRKQQIIGHWETGYSQPDLNTLFSLCDIYGTTMDDAFGFNPRNKVNLSNKDLEFIKKFQALDEHGQKTINYMIKKELDRVKQLYELKRELIGIGLSHNKPNCLYPFINDAKSASTFISTYKTHRNNIVVQFKENADFIIELNDEGMKPIYNEGDKLYVKKTASISIDEIGVFLYNGAIYIRKTGKNSLLSPNEAFGEIIPKSNENVVVLGRVIDRVE